MKPPSCAHLTVLNPVRHPRIFYKWAWSQRDWGWQVTIMGQGEPMGEELSDGIRLVKNGVFTRSIVPRLAGMVRIVQWIFAHPHDLVVIHAPELLPLAWWLRVFTRTRVVYDMHEDFYQNLRFGTHHAAHIRILAGGWRWLENRLASRLNAVTYAEACYGGSLEIPENRTLVLENKFTQRALQASAPSELPPQPYVLFTGTISPDWGITEALSLWREMHAVRPVHFVLAGYAPLPQVLAEVQAKVEEWKLEKWFTLEGGTSPVTYDRICHLIQGCVAGFALYQPTPQLRGKRPTKFFEYPFFGKPLIFTPLPEWIALNQNTPMGFPRTTGLSPGSLWQLIDGWTPAPEAEKEDFLWENEEKRLKKVLEQIIFPA